MKLVRPITMFKLNLYQSPHRQTLWRISY